MKLPIKKKYFDRIKSGKKTVDFRDAHITFVCEETGEKLTKEVIGVEMMPYESLPKELKTSLMFGDSTVMVFKLK